MLLENLYFTLAAEMIATVSAFYRFAAIGDCASLQAALRDLCREWGIKGTILIAHEGINGTIAGSQNAIEYVESWLRIDTRFAGLETKRSTASCEPFQRLKIKIKREIVTFGAPEVNPAQRTGTYVDAAEWNALIRDPGVTLIDTRNVYEVKVGSFPGAIDPGTATFKDFPRFVRQSLNPSHHRKVAMFCTGGIRCEKASAYLLSQGFSEVFHLNGGILKYLEKVPRDDSLWQGECFVFDERVALQHGLRQGASRLCEVCGYPILPKNVDAGHSEQDALTIGLCLQCSAKV